MSEILYRLCPAYHSTGEPPSFWHCVRAIGHAGKHRDANDDEWLGL